MAAKVIIKVSYYTGRDVSGYFVVLGSCLYHQDITDLERLKFSQKVYDRVSDLETQRSLLQ
jgi:hypothetical protein